jgi:hypothetical protein
MAEATLEELKVQLKQQLHELEKHTQKVVIDLCHHVKENGWRCGSPAVHDRHYCHYHLQMRGRRLKMARARARRERWLVELPPLEDLYAVQVGLQHVMDALASGQLDRRLGYAMLYGLQQASSNLRLPKEAWDESCRFGEQGKTEWPGFEAAHGLPEGFDVDTAPEKAFPPPVTSPAATELTGEDGVSADELELEELQTLDAEACKHRAAQLVRKYQHRMQRDREKLARVLRVREAAHRNAEAQKEKSAKVSAAAGKADGGAVSASDTPGPALAANAGATTVSAETDASVVASDAKKSPQKECPDRADERVTGAS